VLSRSNGVSNRDTERCSDARPADRKLNFKDGRLSALYQLAGSKGRPTAKIRATTNGSMKLSAQKVEV
jgi:hypothetical protein